MDSSCSAPSLWRARAPTNGKFASDSNTTLNFYHSSTLYCHYHYYHFYQSYQSYYYLYYYYHYHHHQTTMSAPEATPAASPTASSKGSREMSISSGSSDDGSYVGNKEDRWQCCNCELFDWVFVSAGSEEHCPFCGHYKCEWCVPYRRVTEWIMGLEMGGWEEEEAVAEDEMGEEAEDEEEEDEDEEMEGEEWWQR
jgi:hypothetical protein